MFSPARQIRRFAVLSIVTLSACGTGDRLFSARGGDADAPQVARQSSSVERDVEAPDVFQVSEPGLWDGRPSLGGVWVAHPSTKDPERVIIRNAENGKSVIGALFRRERDNPGPALQVSSDAAEALGLLAGNPTGLSVTALRRESVSDTPVETVPGPATLSADGADPMIPENVQTIPAPEAIDATSLDTPGQAPDLSHAVPPATLDRAIAQADVARQDARPFVRIGALAFAPQTTTEGTRINTLGPFPRIIAQSGKSVLPVPAVLGPATSPPERRASETKVKRPEFADVYPVTG